MNQEKFEELLLHQLSEIGERMSSIENRLSSLEQGMAWVRGKLEVGWIAARPFDKWRGRTRQKDTAYGSHQRPRSQECQNPNPQEGL